MKVKPLDYRQLRIMAGPFPETVKIVYHDGREHSPCSMAKHAAEYIKRGAVDMRPGAARATTTQRPKHDMSRAQFVTALRALISTPTPAAAGPQKAPTTMTDKEAMAEHNRRFKILLDVAKADGLFTDREINSLAAVSHKYTCASLSAVIDERRAEKAEQARVRANLAAKMGLAPAAQGGMVRQGNQLVAHMGQK